MYDGLNILNSKYTYLNIYQAFKPSTKDVKNY